jgi:hypothetical protein
MDNNLETCEYGTTAARMCAASCARRSLTMHGTYPICKWQQQNTVIVFTIGGPSRSSPCALVPTHGLCIGSGRASRTIQVFLRRFHVYVLPAGRFPQTATSPASTTTCTWLIWNSSRSDRRRRGVKKKTG